MYEQVIFEKETAYNTINLQVFGYFKIHVLLLLIFPLECSLRGIGLCLWFFVWL